MGHNRTNRRTRLETLLLILIVALAPAGLLLAEEAKKKHPTEYTRVAVWQVKRSHWSDFTDRMIEIQKPVMEKLLADGTITEWGVEAAALHKADGYTHATWFATPNHANAMKVWQAMEDAGKKRGDKVDDVDKQIDNMVTKHRDFLLRSIRRGATDANIENGLFYQYSMRINIDSLEDHLKLWDATIAPVLQKMLENGEIVAYGLDEEEITSQPYGERTTWIAAKDMSAMDAMKAAFDADRKNWSEYEYGAWWASMKGMIDVDSYREYMGNMIIYGRSATK